MRKSMKHPRTGFIYTQLEFDKVEVRDPTTDQYGIFNSTGTWYEGDLRDADQQILGWIGRAPAARNKA